MCAVRVSVAETDVADLELALGYALSMWTNALTVGRSTAWETYATTGHAIRNTLAWMGPVCGSRVVFWSDDAADALHAVARQVEQGPFAFAALAPTVRRYAERANDAPRGTAVARDTTTDGGRRVSRDDTSSGSELR